MSSTTNLSSVNVNVALKAKYSFYSTLVFFLVANPETFKLTQRVFGGFLSIASAQGAPTPYGFFLHTFVFFLVLWGLMMFPRDP
jgi:hypothetical protein